jgi:hypothetical protein
MKKTNYAEPVNDGNKKDMGPGNTKLNNDQKIVNEEEENGIVNNTDEYDLNAGEDFTSEKEMNRLAQQEIIENDNEDELEDKPDEKII